MGLHLMDHSRPPDLMAESALKAPTPVDSVLADTNIIQHIQMPALAEDPKFYSPYADAPKSLLTSFSE
jgi:hypothetical protein